MPTVAPAVPAVAPATPMVAPAAKPSKRRRTGLVAVAAVAVLALVGIGFAVWSAFFAPYEINEDRFSDPMLRAAILAQLDPDGDGKVSRDEAASLESLAVEGAVDVAGLGLFPNLRTLELSGGILRSVDVADCPSLETLVAEGCSSLAEVVLGDKPALRTLELPGAQIGAIDLSGTPVLETLNLEGSPLTELALTGCSDLSSVDVRGTTVASLDLSANSALTTLLVDDAVHLDNLGATPLHEHWAVTSFSRSVPTVNVVEGYEVRAEGEYDEAGRLIAIDAYEYDQEGRYEYAYDEAGRCIAMDGSGSNGSPAVHWDISYDEQGRLLRATSDMGDEWAYSYNADGRLESCRVAVGQGGASKLSFAYDEAGRLASWSHAYEGGEAPTWNIAYDEAGAVRSVARVAADSFSTETYTVERDGNGELTRMTFDWGHYGSYVQEQTYGEPSMLRDAARDVQSQSAMMYHSCYAVSSTVFEYDEQGRLVKWEPSYRDGSDGAAKQGSNALGYKRFLTVDDTFDGPAFVRVGDILSPSFDPYFWNPLVSFGIDGGASFIAYNGVPSIFGTAAGTQSDSSPSEGEASGAAGQAASDQSSSAGDTADASAAGAEASVEPVGFTGISSAVASTEFPVDEVNTSGYDAMNVLDGKLESAWIEGAPGTGAGEWITLSGDGEQGFSGFEIWSGYHKSEQRYDVNARPARISVYVDDEKVGTYDLADAGLVSQRVDFGGTHVGRELKILIEDVYPGSRDEDCAISEIKAF